MQRTIKKVLAELSTDKPDLSYIRGLLEGLVDDDSASQKFSAPDRMREAVNTFIDHADEETIPSSVQVGPLGHLA